jgi:hypothetical protein
MMLEVEALLWAWGSGRKAPSRDLRGSAVPNTSSAPADLMSVLLVPQQIVSCPRRAHLPPPSLMASSRKVGKHIDCVSAAAGAQLLCAAPKPL